MLLVLASTGSVINLTVTRLYQVVLLVTSSVGRRRRLPLAFTIRPKQIPNPPIRSNNVEITLVFFRGNADLGGTTSAILFAHFFLVRVRAKAP